VIQFNAAKLGLASFVKRVLGVVEGYQGVRAGRQGAVQT
jgi:hypothetical protein